MLVEDSPGSRTAVSGRSQQFPVRQEFQNASYLQRFELLGRRMMQENLYTAASVSCSPASAVKHGKFSEMSAMTGLQSFVTSFAARIAAEAVR